jgi:hypothetical protein
METCPEIASRKRNDPAKTQAAACLRPKIINSQMPDAIPGPATRESARSVDNWRWMGIFIFTALKRYYGSE